MGLYKLTFYIYLTSKQQNKVLSKYDAQSLHTPRNVVSGYFEACFEVDK